MSVNIPIVNAGIKYVNELHIEKFDSQNISMNAGAARDSTNTNDIILTNMINISTSFNGANGLDWSTVSPDTFYAVYVIGDTTKYRNPAGLLSLSDSDPNLPFGYDIKRRVGWIRTNSSSEILNFYQFGEAQDKSYWYENFIQDLSLGNATSFTEVEITVPPINTEVNFVYVYTSSSPTNFAEFSPFGSNATDGLVAVGSGVAGQQVGTFTVPCKVNNNGKASILYRVMAGDTLNLFTSKFKDFLA